MSYSIVQHQKEAEPCKIVYLSEQPPAPAVILEDYGDVLTIDDLCRITGLAANSLRREISSGRLPGCKVCGRFLVSKADFINHLRGDGTNASR